MSGKTSAISTQAMKEPGFSAHMAAALREHYYRRDDSEFYRSETYLTDLRQHTHERFGWANDFVIPWLASSFDPAGKYFVEVGCGTGSSTLAFASVARRLECFEISSNSLKVAEARLAYWGIDNVSLRDEPFVAGVTLSEPGNVDGVILFATLEHMTLEEALGVLSLSWEVIRPGGVIIVADTPNRFSPFDHHTSFLPLFSQLPREVQIRYADRSPRALFRDAMRAAWAIGEEQAKETLLRLGNGISFHEFELALGDSIHDRIVLTGHEKPMTRLFPIGPQERLLAELFAELGLSVSPAFTRPNMNLVIRKPFQITSGARTRRKAGAR